MRPTVNLWLAIAGLSIGDLARAGGRICGRGDGSPTS